MQPLEIRVPHSLTRDELHRRIDAAIARARSEYEPQLGPIEATWVDPDRLAVGVSVMGMRFDGQAEVRDSDVLVRITLPGMAALFAGKIRDGIEEKLGGLLTAQPA